MKPFPALSEDGKIRRLHHLAGDVLTQYDLQPRRVALVAHRANTTFRVDTTDRRTFALRIGPAAGDSVLHTKTEIAWLVRLGKDGLVPVATPVANRSGQLITEGDRIDVPGPRTCVLFDWIPGQPVGDAARPLDYAMLGETAAHLHDQAATWKRRHGLHPLVWDRVFYYPGEEPVIYDGRFRRLMTAERTAVVSKVERKAARELTRIHRSLPLSMLHGDLHPWNVHLHGGALHVFDFEEVMLGAPVQDIAITLWHASGHRSYPKLLDAFIEGYRTVREWPVEYSGQVNLLMAARSVMLLDYALRRGAANEAFVGTTIERIAAVL